MQHNKIMGHDSRFSALDALRGCAAFAVLTAHSFNYYPDHNLSATIDDSAIVAARILFNGTVAVSVFFIISGFVLSYHYFSGKKKISHLATDIAYRTPRLFIPVVLTGIPCFFLQYYTPIWFGQIDLQQFQKSPWIDTWNVSDWKILEMLNFLFFKVFAFYDSSISFNVNLWTMKIEYTFSFVVFLICGWYLKSPRAVWFLIPVVLALPFTWQSTHIGYFREVFTLSNFVSGAILAWAVVNVDSLSKVVSRLNRLTAFSIAIIFCGIGGYYVGGSVPTMIVNEFSAAIFFVLALSFSIAEDRKPTAKWLCILGEISFPLYLIHGSIFYFVFTAISSYEVQLSLSGFLVGLVVSSIITVVMSLLFTRFIEMPVLKFAKRKTQLLIN